MPVVAWNAVADGDLAGYHIYYGAVSGVYTGFITVLAPLTTCAVGGFGEQNTMYYAITAYDTLNNESAKSSVVMWGCRKPPRETIRYFRHFH